MNDMVDIARRELIGFGPFVLDRAGKQLRRDGCPVQVGSRALDLLVMLVTHAGTVVSRAALVAFVWPRTVVEETSLRVHISALRRALGDAADGAPRYIANVPGRGYSFVMPVHTVDAGATAAPPARAAARMPPGPARTFGRADVVKLIGDQLARKRLLSIVGPGGMGKTTVALAVAEASAANYPDGMRFVDLAGLSDPAKLAAMFALAVGALVPQSDPMPALAEFLRARRMLIVLDNCEHVVHAAAALAEAVLVGAPGVQIIATSREPLDANGEWVHRLAPLAAPEPASAADPAQALGFPAVQLFVERARAVSDGFTLDAANIALVLQLCQRLDGIALAIELAAARVDGLGLAALVARLDEMFQLLTRGRRTVLPRHRTLLALFDWSYALLDAPERHVLACLSVFRSRFTLEAAVAVAGGGAAALAPDAIVDCVLSLAAKSLVAVDAGAGAACSYRLLYTTRTYAAERLRDSGAGAEAARRHAGYVLGVFTRSWDQTNHLAALAQWQNLHAYLMDDVRAALDWAVADGGDIIVGVQLVMSAYQAVYGVGELDIYRGQVERAIEQITRLEPPQPELELRARTAWCYLSGQTERAQGARVGGLDSTLALAERLGSPQQLIFALHGVCCGQFGHGDYPDALAAARRIRTHTAAGDPAAVLLSDRLAALNLHFLGRHEEARVLALAVLAHPEVAMPPEYVSHTPRGVSQRVLLARIAWIEGHTELGLQLAGEAVALSTVNGCVPFVACQAYGMAAVPLALWCGDIERAAALNAQLAAHALAGGLQYWAAWSRSFDYAIALAGRQGSHADWQPPSNPKERDMLATFDTSLACVATIARCEAGTVGWCAPEVLRAQGEQLLRTGAAGAGAQAEALFERALALARTQRALAWELRAATSLARLWQDGGRGDAGAALLAPLVARFGAGRSTADLRRAGGLLDQCSTEVAHAQ